MGVEEEFLLVDPRDGRVRALAAAALNRCAEGEQCEVEAELQLQQIETNTEPCISLSDLGRQIRHARGQAAEAARSVGAEIAAMATSALPAETSITPGRRYQRMRERFGLRAEEQLTCGCHIHVEVGSDEEGVAILDRMRSWLPTLLALSANSPFWQGKDSAYSSYRAQVWTRWPSAGPTELFGSAETYHDTVRAMTETQTVLDTGMIYFDARLAQRYPTVEIRVADVCLHPDDAVLLAALARALVQTAEREWRNGEAAAPVRLELIRLAGWRASRSGLETELLDPRTMRPAPALEVIDGLLEHLRDALEDSGDHADVIELRDALLSRGNGARQQREMFRESGRLADVVAECARRTAPSGS